MNSPSHKEAQPLVQNPVLDPKIEFCSQSEDELIVRRWDRTLVMRGRSIPLVARLISELDGEKDTSLLAEKLGVTPLLVVEVLNHLYNRGIVVDKNSVHNNFGILSAFSGSSLSQGGYGQLQNKTVLVDGPADLPSMISQNLSESGLGKVLIPQTSSLTIESLVTQEPAFIIYAERIVDYKRATKLNKIAIQLNIPWIAGWFEGPNIVVTHVMIPNENACFECLILRQRANYLNYKLDMIYENFIREGRPSTQTYIPESMFSVQENTPGMDNMLARFLTVRAVSYLLGMRSIAPVPKLVEFSLPNLVSRHHPVLRLPQCPVCSPAVLQGGTKAYDITKDTSSNRRE
ncbi:MAG: hypothetical protein ACPGWR_03655 [Ardenticatenaceae bacterium]